MLINNSVNLKGAEKVKSEVLKWIRQHRPKPGERFMSQRELATMLNVDPMTAHKALTELTRQGVLYRVRGKGSFIGHSPQSTHSLNLALVLARPNLQNPQDNINNWHIVQNTTASFMQALNDHDTFSTVIIPTDGDFNDAQNRLLHYDAVFFIGDEEYCELINNMLTSKQTQVCLIDPSNKEKNCLQLSLSLKESAYRAVSFMARNGYRRIAYIGSDHHPEGKLSGYKLALKEYGLPLIEKNIIIGINAQTDGQRGVSILMGHGMDCDSIFVDTDSKAAGVITYLAQQGLKVPEDIGVMGFDGLDVFVKAPPYLTTVKTCFKEVIEKALELLREKDRNEIIERCIEYPGKIIVNRTTFNGKNLTTNPEPLNYSSPLIMNNV